MHKFKIIFVILLLFLISFFILAQKFVKADGMSILTEDFNIGPEQSVVVSWTTNIEATCKTYHDENSGLTNSVRVDGEIIETPAEDNSWRYVYEATVNNLKDDTNYYYNVECSQGEISSVSSIYSLNKFDIDRDLTVDIADSYVTENSSSTLSWTTNLDTSCRINFADNAGLNNSTRYWGAKTESYISDEIQYSFTLNVDDLEKNKYYYYDVVCIIGNDTYVSDVQTVEMYEEDEYVDIELGGNGITEDLSATVSWNTNTEAECSLKFNSEYDELEGSTYIPGSLVLSGNVSNGDGGRYYYQVKLENLAEDTDYYYQIKCYTEFDEEETEMQTLVKATGDNENPIDSIIEEETIADNPEMDAILEGTDPDLYEDEEEVETKTEDELLREKAVLLSTNSILPILEEIQEIKNEAREEENRARYMDKLKEGVEGLHELIETAINYFITYGIDDNTKRLGAGERAAVIHSFKAAFNTLPMTEDAMTDTIRIANGRWPNNRSVTAENKAKDHFVKIYKRSANMENPHDDAAITVMAYGLRQKAENRNLNSERVGITTFKHIYGHNPQTTEEWNIMQAITYSGATREVDTNVPNTPINLTVPVVDSIPTTPMSPTVFPVSDTDGDGLTDAIETELGTDANNPDSDGDGYSDGTEVENGYNPLGEGRL